MSLYWIYKRGMTFGKPVIEAILNRRLRDGKEDPDRVTERHGIASKQRPDGPLLWVHVASVGEAQSVLPIISLFLEQVPEASVLVTSITRNSATLLETRLPPRAFHQYLPVDRPAWVRRFMLHWKPDLVLWAESELWPAILAEIRKRHLPAALLNARLSPKSFANWSRAPKFIESILSTFTVILTQTDLDNDYFTALGARSVVTVGNIKFAAPPLPVQPNDLIALTNAIGARPVWVYASSHAGEEELAVKTHVTLQNHFPDLLTIIVPRHPERRTEISRQMNAIGQDAVFRGNGKQLPTSGTQVYIADTLGELGLFYSVAPVACIGRSFSNDGGGGHNPLEAGLLNCAVLHGPHIQNLAEIYTEMDESGAALRISAPEDLASVLMELLSHKDALQNLRDKAHQFARSKNSTLQNVVKECEPIFLLANLPLLKVPS